MKKTVVCILLVGLMLGAGISIAGAGEIKSGSIETTIEGFYGKTTPELNLPEDVNVTLKAKKVEGENETKYQVSDNLSIPINVAGKEEVLFRKMIHGFAVAYRNGLDVPIRGTFSNKVKNGTIWNKSPVSDIIVRMLGGRIVVSDVAHIEAGYEISEEQFENGENMTMMAGVWGGPLPGETPEPNVVIDVDKLCGDKFLKGKLIKEFTDITLDLDGLLSFDNTSVISAKKVTLHVDYILSEEETEGYTLDVESDGNGTVVKTPAKEEYEAGTEVEIKAVPDSGYVFDHWSGNVSGTDSPINVTMDGNKSIVAHFEESPVLVKPEKTLPRLGIGFGGIKISVKNQMETNTSVDYEISVKGGILGNIDVSGNGTLENISAGSSKVIAAPSLGFGFGGVKITVEVTVPEEGTIAEEYSAKVLGPLVIYQ